MTRITFHCTVLSAVLAGCGGEDGPAPKSPGQDGALKPTPAESHEKMLGLLRDIAARTPDEHHYQGDARARGYLDELRRLGDRAPWKLYLDAGIAELQLGNERRGIDLLSHAHRHLTEGTMAGGYEARMQVAFHLGVGWLRRAETENCCATAVAESCILPLRDGAVHAEQEPSKNAMRYLREVMDGAPETSRMHLAAKWLFNIAAMTLGEYPDSVPEEHRIPPVAFETDPEVGIPRFENIAARLGLDTFSLSGGAIADDFDNDGYLDLVVSTWDTKGQLRYFHNDRDGTFTERTEAAGLNGLFGGLNMVQADYDNDGHLDFLVLRGAWLFENGRHPNSLIRNNGNGTFTDVTFAAGLGESHFPTQTADWADFDNDGDLDLFVGSESSKQGRYPCQLFRNEGDGTFTEIARGAGVENFGFAKAVVWGDYDGDRLPDLYVSNLAGPNRLYHNRGDGTFEDEARRLGVAEPETSFPAWFWDFDNDGALDLYVSCYGTGIGHIAAYHLGLPTAHDLARLYRGDGTGGFEDVAEQMGLDYPAMPMGSNFGDLDNDGWLDFYLGTGNVNYDDVMPNLMFLNRNGERFVDVTMAGGFGHLQKGHGIAFADFDNDGDQDVFEEMGGAYKGDGFRDALYENPGFGNRWLTVQLVGTVSNRSAIGARIRVEVVEDGEARSIFRHVNSGGSFGCNPLRQTIGLGRAERITRLEVFWPTTGKTQAVDGAGLDCAIRIVEGQDGYEEIELERLRLGGR